MSLLAPRAINTIFRRELI